MRLRALSSLEQHKMSSTYCNPPLLIQKLMGPRLLEMQDDQTFLILEMRYQSDFHYSSLFHYKDLEAYEVFVVQKLYQLMVRV